MYELIYNGEVIDTAETLDYAKYLKQEYCMAFKTTAIKIKKVRS